MAMRVDFMKMKMSNKSMCVAPSKKAANVRRLRDFNGVNSVMLSVQINRP